MTVLDPTKGADSTARTSTGDRAKRTVHLDYVMTVTRILRRRSSRCVPPEAELKDSITNMPFVLSQTHPPFPFPSVHRARDACRFSIPRVAGHSGNLWSTCCCLVFVSTRSLVSIGIGWPPKRRTMTVPCCYRYQIDNVFKWTFVSSVSLFLPVVFA